MVENRYLSLSAANYDKLKANFQGMHIWLVILHQETLVDKYAELKLDGLDKTSLLASPAVKDRIKFFLVNSIEDETVSSDSNLARLSCQVLSEQAKTGLSYTALRNMMIHTHSDEQRIKLLNKHLDDLEGIEVQALVEEMSGDYPECFRKRHRPRFNNTDFRRTLSNG